MNTLPPPRRKNSLRLNTWDYSSPGPYFFTICTHERLAIFIDQNNRQIALDSFRAIAAEEAAVLHAIVVAADHVHGIVTLGKLIVGAGPDRGPASHGASPDRGSASHGAGMPAPTLSRYVGRSKVKTSQLLNISGCFLSAEPTWQRSFYDHVIRDEEDYLKKARYVENHPLKEEGDIFAEWH